MERKSLVFDLAGIVLPLRGGKVGVRSGIPDLFENLRQHGNNVFVVHTGETDRYLVSTLKRAKLLDVVSAPVLVTHDRYVGRNYSKVAATAGIDQDKVVNEMLIFGQGMARPADVEAVFVNMKDEFKFKADATRKIAERIFEEGLSDFWVGFEKLAGIYKGLNDALEFENLEAMFSKSRFKNSFNERLERRIVTLFASDQSYNSNLEVVR